MKRIFPLVIVGILATLSGAEQSLSVLLLPPGGTLPSSWSFSEGSEFPGAAGALDAAGPDVLRLAYDFSGGGNYVAAYCAIDPPVPLDKVSFRMSSEHAVQITVRVTDKTGQTFQKSIHFAYSGWRDLEFGMDDWALSWGGADDGELQQPIQRIGILVDRSGSSEATGHILIAAVTGHPLSGVPEEAPEPAIDRGMYRGPYRVSTFGPDAGFGLSGPAEWDGKTLRIDFTEGNRVALRHSISLLGTPERMSLVLRGGQPGNVVSMRLGSHFQSFFRTLGALEGGDQSIEFPAPPEGWDFSGGANDGRVRPPLRLLEIAIDRGDAPEAATAIEFIELLCHVKERAARGVTLVASLEAAPDTEGGYLASIEGCNILGHALDGELTFQVRDWDRRLLHEARYPWPLAEMGATARKTIPVELDERLPFFETEWTYRAPGQRPATALATWTAPLDNPGKADLRPESPWGMGVYLYRYPGTPDGYERMDRAAILARDAGVKWSREEFQWHRIEPEQGRFDFAYYDKLVETAHRHGISVYGLLAYWSHWTEPYTEKGIDDFCAYARATVLHFKDRIKHWEVYNEPNIFFWSGPPELYPVLLTRAYAAIKEADPEAQVLGISTAGIDNGFIQMCLDQGAPFDILTIHPYRAKLNEATFMKELQTTGEQVGGRPVWITEMGWSTQIGGVSERDQALWLARTYLSAVASGACNNVSWYNFRNDGENPFYNEENFGVLYLDMSPKPAYRALATVCRTFDQDLPERRNDFGDGIFALAAESAIALWTPDHDRTLVCRIVDGEPEVRNLMGTPIPLSVRDGLLTLELQAGAPLFITGANPAPADPTIQSEDDDTIRF